MAGTFSASRGHMAMDQKVPSAAAPAAAPSSGCPPRHSRDLRTDRGPKQRPLTRPILKFDLSDESDALQHEDGWRNTGHSAKTLVKHHDFRIVLIAMKKGARLEEHQTAGAISIQPIQGQLRLRVGAQTIELPVGALLALDRGLSHDVEALVDSVFVLSVHVVP